jgi:predicted ATPase/DNA-binding SARP family transcriptional activator
MPLVAVLGPLELRGPDGVVVAVRSGRQRRLLAALALHPAAPVAADALAEAVWGEDLPVDPAAALQTNIARLRRLLPAGVEIVTEPGGYRLGPAEAVDAVRFERLVADARTSDPQVRPDLLREALELWRGRPFPELEHPDALAEVARLDALRAGAIEARADALLVTGRAAEAVADLEALAASDPLRESAVGLLARALVATGRQGDALRAFTRLRHDLAEQLGIDPSPELRHLEEQVLRQELVVPEPPVRASSEPPLPVAAPAPASLAPPVAVPVSAFVGRDADLARAVDALAACRIVTLCGAGGVGKSRLARHVAAEVADRYADGVVMVELAERRDARDVEAAVAAAVGLSDAGADVVGDRLVDLLRVRHLLVVLDDCERLAEAVAALAARLVTGTATVDILATSREPLRADGERVLAIGPLDRAAATELLADRIAAAGGEVGDAAALAALADRLDRLPLALELAAARAPALGLDGLAAALDEPLALGVRRAGPARHRSLRDVVEWSYEMLGSHERALFERLADFAGPVDADDVAAVCADEELPPVAVRLTLADLADRSLVVAEPPEYRMLETLRAFGRQRLTTSSHAAALRRRHATWALELARALERDARGPDEPRVVPRFVRRIADLRQAHDRLLATGRVDDALELAAAVASHACRSLRFDLVRLAEETAPLAREHRSRWGVVLLARVAGCAWPRGDVSGAEELAWHAIAEADALGAPELAREAWQALGNVHAMRGDLDEAMAAVKRTSALAARVEDRYLEGEMQVDASVLCAYRGDDDGAARHEAEALRLARTVGAPSLLGWVEYAAGERRAEHDPAAAVPHLERAIALAADVDARFVAGVSLHTLLTTSARSGDPSAARTRFAPLLDHWHGLGAWTQLSIAIRALVEALSREERHAEVARLLGALQALRRAAPPYGADAERLALAAERAREALGARYDDEFAAGSSSDDSETIALARRLCRGE